MGLDYKEIADAWESQKPQGRSGGKTFWFMISMAIQKQIPAKPAVIPTTKDIPTTHNLGRLLHFHCPRCGKFIVGLYETDVVRGGGISKLLNGCSNCLQAIDFTEWRCKEAEKGGAE